MPSPVRPSLNAAEILGALSALAEGRAPHHPAPDSRWILASALALRRTELPKVRASRAGREAAAGGELWGPGEGARILPFPGVERSASGAPGRSAAEDGDPAGREGGAVRSVRGATVRLVPDPGAVPGLDEGRSGFTVFRSLEGGVVLGRVVPEGARILASRRDPVLGDLAVFATRKTLGLCPAGAPPPGGRILAVVEAVLPG